MYQLPRIVGRYPEELNTKQVAELVADIQEGKSANGQNNDQRHPQPCKEQDWFFAGGFRRLNLGVIFVLAGGLSVHGWLWHYRR